MIAKSQQTAAEDHRYVRELAMEPQRRSLSFVGKISFFFRPLSKASGAELTCGANECTDQSRRRKKHSQAIVMKVLRSHSGGSVSRRAKFSKEDQLHSR